MKSWFYAARKTQTLRGVSTRLLRTGARPSSRAWPKTFQARDEQCIHLALLIQTFLLLPSPKPCFFFFFSYLFTEWQKENGFQTPSESSVSPGSWHCTSRDTEQRRGICATAWAFCSTSAILIPQLVSHSSRVTQLGDFKWFTRKRSSLFCVVSFWTTLIMSLLEKELMAVFAI